ncbi:hypothetical protein ABTN05_20665, partial [Acinetobacter baumannii]
LPEDEARALLEPWIGSGNLLKTLPIPSLIDFVRKKDGRLDADDIQQQFRTVARDIHVDDHGEGLAGLARLSRGFSALGYL